MNKNFAISIIINILFIICASILFIQLFLQLGNTHERIRNALQSFDELREEYTADFKIVFERLDRLERKIEEVRNDCEKRISQPSIDTYKQKDEVSTKATETSDISINAGSITPPVNDYHGLEEDVLRLEDVTLSSIYKNGTQAFKKADYTKARRYFKELIGIEPPVYEVWVSYIWASYYESPGRTAGDDDIIKMLRLLPDYLDSKGEISKLRGLVAIETGNYAEAKSFIITSLERHPSDSELTIILGKTAFSYRDYETCTTLLEDVIRKGPVDAETTYILGNAYEELGDYEEALMYYNRCLDGDKAFFKVYKRIGEIKKRKGDYEGAAMVIRKYLDYTRDAYSLLSLGECYIALNDSEKAFSVLHEVVDDFSGSQYADKAEMLLRTIKGNGS